MSSKSTLKRHISPFSLLLAGVTGVIGSGWLFASMYAAQIAGPAAIISWFIGGLAALLFSLIYAEMCAMLPVAGVLARLPFFSHGSLAGFSASWLLWIGYIVVAPIEVTAVLDYASNYIPELTTTVAGDRVLSTVGLIVAGLLMLLFAFINMLGVRLMTRVNSVITIWKLIVPVGAAVALIWVGFRPENFTEFGGFAPNGVAGILGAVGSGGVIFSFIGFRSVLDLSGEAIDPHRSIPIALIGTFTICLTLYVILQVAFIGAIPVDHLSGGWASITENVPGGPFAAFAATLGLPLIAFALYIDAAISPSATALVYMGTSSRVNYAMAFNHHMPSAFTKLNRFHVPATAILFNFAIGMLIFLPFPSWDRLVQFISSAMILSMIFSPASFLALRAQVPELNRPFKLKFAPLVAAVCFPLGGFILYWTGWETNFGIMLLLLLGLIMMFITRLANRSSAQPLHASSSIWVWVFIAGLAVISYLGSYGNGLGVLSELPALLLITGLSWVSLWLSQRQRLSSDEVKKLIET